MSGDPVQPGFSYTVWTSTSPSERVVQVTNDASVFVGPNDYLVVNVPIHDIPKNRVEDYLRRIKKRLKEEVFKDAVFRDRIIFVAGTDKWSFGAIRTEEEPQDRARKPRRPIVMG